MAIELTWKNIGTLVVIMGGILIAFFAGTGAMMEWRIEAVQSQLADRMRQYERETDMINKRLDRLEDHK